MEYGRATKPENKILYKVDALDELQSERMNQVLKTEDQLLKSMESDCERLTMLKDQNGKLEEKKNSLLTFLMDQKKQLEVMSQRPPMMLPEVRPPTQYASPPAMYANGGYMLTNSNGANGSGAFQFDKEIRIHAAQVHGVAMGKSSEVIATASWDQSVKIFNLRANQVVQTFGMANDVNPNQELRGLYSIAFSKTSDELVGCTSSDKSIYLWNHQTGVLKHRITGHANEVNDIDFHPTQQIMATAADDCKCIVWDVQEGILLRTLDQHYKSVYGCTFLGRENQFLLATGSFDQYVRIFDMRDKSEVAVSKEHTDDVIGMDYNSQKQLMVTGSDDGTVCIWDARTWKLKNKIDTSEYGRHNEVKRVAFSPNGAMIAAASSTGKVLVYDTDAGTQLAALDGHTECVFDVAWGVDCQTNAKLLVSASHDTTCRVWRVMA